MEMGEDIWDVKIDFQNSKNGKKYNFLLLEHFQKVESKSGLAGSVFKIG